MGDIEAMFFQVEFLGNQRGFLSYLLWENDEPETDQLALKCVCMSLVVPPLLVAAIMPVEKLLL